MHPYPRGPLRACFLEGLALLPLGPAWPAGRGQQLQQAAGAMPRLTVPTNDWVAPQVALPMQETRVWSLGREDPLEEGLATRSSTPAWRIPWIEEPGGLESIMSHRVGHD